jgi:hypothetical protein
VTHGMNTFNDNEVDVWEKCEELLPLHVKSFIDFVVGVDEIFEVVIR